MAFVGASMSVLSVKAETAILQTVFSEVQAEAAASPRIAYTINDNWRFSGSGNGSEAADLDDKDWELINIPHTWNAQDAFDDKPGYRRGVSWYRRNLRLDPGLKDKQIFLYFEGANQIAEVYVNGSFAGRHIGGYSAFSFDVTKFLKSDGSNLIAVKVDNSFNPNVPPLTADFNFYGGIYRDVWLIAADEVHLKVTDLASSGVQITTPQVSETRATVNVSGTVVNSSGSDRKIEVVNIIVGPDGNDVLSAVSTLDVKAKSELTFEQSTPPIDAPKLWSPDEPNLYRVKTLVRENGRVLDNISNPLGFRWFNFDAEKGFFLNGKPLKLRGTNRHQDHAGLGNALPDSMHVRDMQLIKDTGYNFVRLAHYPQDPAVLEAADRLGLLLWEETPLVNYITISPEFNENSALMVREMIRQHRNHPSVVLWGYMNEIYLRVPKENAENIRKETVVLARKLEKIAREEDPSRPTAIAFHNSDLYNTMGLGEIPQVIGWNLYNGWYRGTFEDFGKFLDEQHSRYPNRPLIVSEYGANSDLRLHATETRRFDSTTEYQRMFHENYLAQINARPFVAGSSLWNEFDFGSERRGENMPNVNNKGMFTFYRKPKDVHYFYKANFSTQPVLHIAATDWKYRGGTDSTPHKIDVYSNLADVELFLNGTSLGKKKPNGSRKATWDVAFRDGENLLTATGLQSGSSISHSTKVFYKRHDINSPEIAVNVGSNAQFIDGSNTVWLADQPYRSGSWGFIGTEAKAIYAAQTDDNVLNTQDDPLFQTMQEGLTAYRFDVPNGTYEVELRFVETKFEKAAERVFNIAVNGRTVVAGLDLASAAGLHHGLKRRFRTDASNGIVIEFAAVAGKPILSAIRIRRL